MATPPSAAELSPRQLAAQLVIPVFDLRPERVDDLDAEWARAAAYAEDGFGGLILFGGDRETLGERLEAVKAKAPVPMLVGADIERGVAQQVGGARVQPPAMALGAADSEALAEEAGRALAAEALSLGIDWVLGPVLDLADEPLNPIVGTRAFSADPARVAALGAAYIRGIESTGALACAKHFPGHGGTLGDSHDSLPVVERSAEQLRAADLVPFRAAIEAGVSSFMTAHVSYPTLTPGDDRPSTLNPQITRGLLRDELGFTGLVVTDALIMDGVQQDTSEGEAAVLAIQAGCDLLLYPKDPRAVVSALALWSEAKPENLELIRAAASRVLERKARLANRAPLALPEAPADRIAASALTWCGDVPAPLAKGQSVAVVVFDDDGIPGLGHELVNALTEAGLDVRPAALGTSITRVAASRFESLTADVERVVAVVGCRVRAWKGRAGLCKPLKAVLADLPPGRSTVVGLCGPYSLQGVVPAGVPVLLAYGDEACCQLAAAKALMGGEANGRLPVPA